ncbi:NAD(P)/FAD-dependent oxidoreductase [Rubellimicrobium arenae]|uniref:NAD(P)/FAD-dependent oxidoreductase n=1 Tax=Rubellimicrobium arenae TaxID=2817372 RepID=UPI001B30510C|nr:FAD-binding oxidoreductase [Rubellimicrobium arenae]
MGSIATRWDLVVVGAGIVGCSAAYYAARAGLRVLLVERDAPGSAQSGRNLGFVRQQARDFAELDLMIGAMRLWEGLEAELGRPVGWRQGGNVALLLTEADLVSRRDWHQRGREEFGLDTRMLSADETFDLLPHLARDRGVLGAMYTPSDGRAEPARATRAFFEAALEHGASVSLGQPVSRIDVSAGHVSGVWAGDRFHRADVVLCAAGAGSAQLLRGAGLDLPQERIRATVVRTAPRPGLRLDPCVSGPQTGIRQDVNGAFVVSVAGGEYDVRPDSWRHMRWYAPTRKANPDAARINYLAPLQHLLPRGGEAPLTDIPPTRDAVRPEERRARQALAEFGQLFPALADLPAETCWAGIIDTLPDLVPVLGPVDDVGGLLVATGFSGHGFGPGPMAGKAMAALAAGQPSPADLTRLSPMRFHGPRPVKAAHRT